MEKTHQIADQDLDVQHILITDPISKESIAFLQDQPSTEVTYKPDSDPTELIDAIKTATGLIVRSKTQVTREVIEKAQHLKVIGRAGAGVDNIDVQTATQHGIVVMNTPGANSTSAAEHAFGLLLCLARQIHNANESLRKGVWDKKRYIGQELHGKIMGVVGLGRIGSILAKKALGFQMTVIAYDPYVSEEYARDLGTPLVELDELLTRADCISLHLPLNDATTGLISKERFSLFKPTALLVNAARGGLIVEEELADALEAKQLSGAALDVFESEPEINARLLKSDRVVLTPHIAGSTVEAQVQVGIGIAKQVSDYLEKGIIVNAVNYPSVSLEEHSRLAPFVELGNKLGAFVGQICDLRINEIGIRFYGELAQLNYKPISNTILTAILSPVSSEPINPINVRAYVRERRLSVVETISSRPRSYSNLISIQLRAPEGLCWVEGAILHKGNVRLVSVDGIPIETHLGHHMLLLRNHDQPGVIGQIGTILGSHSVNIASFVLGRDPEKPLAVGVLNTDSPVDPPALEKIRQIPAIQQVQSISL